MGSAISSTSNPVSGKFHEVPRETLLAGRGCMTRAFAMMIRFIHINLGTQGGADASRCQELVQNLHNFRPWWSAPLANMVQDLVNRAHSGPLSDSDILDFLHRSLTELFTAKYNSSTKVASIIEQTLVFLSSAEGDMWRSAGWLYGLICLYFRWAKTLLVQVAALGGDNTPYTAPKHAKRSNYSEDSDYAAEEDQATASLEKTILEQEEEEEDTAREQPRSSRFDELAKNAVEQDSIVGCVGGIL